MAGIGSTLIKQVCICTWDLEKCEKKWTHILGKRPNRCKTPAFSDMPTYTDGKPDDFEAQDFLVYELDGGVALEIFGPGTGNNPWKRFLDKNGEGVMNVAFFVPDRTKAYEVIGEICDEKKPYHEGFYSVGTYTFVDTMKDLHMELNIKKDENNTELIKELVANPASYKG
ncbi:MAG: hypothetical protein FWC13_02630 [Oscillospiraceae bacterium]|nr:hypothetical protein [Oscillospiraceae bacterium]